MAAPGGCTESKFDTAGEAMIIYPSLPEQAAYWYIVPSLIISVFPPADPKQNLFALIILSLSFLPVFIFSSLSPNASGLWLPSLPIL